MATVSSIETTTSASIGGPLVLGQALLCIGFTMFGASYRRVGFSSEELIYPLSIATMLLALWCIWTWREYGHPLFHPYMLFLAAAFMFNSGQAFLELFRLNEEGMFEGQFNPDTVARTMLLALMGLSATHLGALIAAMRQRREVRRGFTRQSENMNGRSLLLVGQIFLAISILPWLLLKRGELSSVIEGGYMSLYQGDNASGADRALSMVAAFFVPSLILLLLGSRYGSIAFFFSCGLMMVNTLVEFFLGYRAYAMWPLLAFVWSYHRAVKPINRVFLLTAAVVILVLVFPVIQLIRNEGGTDRFSMAQLRQAYTSIDNPVVAILGEMGGSAKSIAHTLELVPQTKTYELGSSYFYALTTAIPNLFGGVHPAIAHGTASDWLVNIVDPWLAERGGGIGFSYIAEAYLNFGWAGSALALVVIGFLVASLFLWATKDGSLAKVAAGAIILSFLTHYTRGEAYTVVRGILWYTMIPYLSILLVSRHGQRQKSPRATARPDV